jgi:hypothetical protein
MYHPIVKEQVLPGQLEELQTNPHPTETQFQSQAEIKEIKTRRAAPKNLRQIFDALANFARKFAGKVGILNLEMVQSSRLGMVGVFCF